MQNSQKGFTLIELMIVVAIIAILAAIAIPQYQNYTVRAKISEAILAADAAKTTISEAFQSGGMTAVDAAASSYTSGASEYVSAVTITSAGVITVTTALSSEGTGLPSDAINKTIKFFPGISTTSNNATTMAALSDGASGPISWGCASSSDKVATKQGFAAADTGSLPAKYAPSTCQ